MKRIFLYIPALFIFASCKDDAAQTTTTKPLNNEAKTDSTTAQILTEGGKVIIDRRSGLPIMLVNDFADLSGKITLIDLKMKIRREIEKLQSGGDQGSERLKAYEKANHYLNKAIPKE